MPWKASMDKQIREMNISRQGSEPIRYQSIKTDKCDTPLLFIGLGGTGLRIGAKTKEKFIECFKPTTAPIAGVDERLPSHTRFIGIDTDEDDIRKLGFAGVERCNIGDANIADMLMPENRHLLPDYITDWLNPDLISSGGTGIDGAQGVRQIGRFDLFTNINEVIKSITTALTQVAPATGRLQVIIAAGLAGGTGSGTFLDISYLVRYVARSLSLPAHLSIMGILVTPDAYVHKDPATADIKRANGYAALKELDYWMEASVRHHDFVQQYTPFVDVKWDQSPFDDCILISSETVSGCAAVNTDENLYGVVSEYVTTLFSKEITYDAIYYAEDHHSFKRFITWRSAMLAHGYALPKQFDVSRRYTAIGVSKGQIPLQEMVYNECVFLFDRVREHYDILRTPDMYDGVQYNSFIDDIVGNCVPALFAPIKVRSPRDATILSIRRFDHLAPHSPEIDDTVRTFMDSLEVQSKSADAIALINERVRMLEQQLVAFFCDPNKGPFYTSRFIDATPGQYNTANKDFEPNVPHNFDLLSVLETRKKEAQNQREQKQAQYKQNVERANTLYHEIKTNPIPLLQNGPTARKYYTACETVIQNKRDYFQQDTLYRLYDAMLIKLDEMNKQIIKPLCKALLSLCQVHEEIDRYMETDEYRLSAPAYCSNIVDPAILLDNFKNVYMTPHHTSQLLEALYQDMMRPYTYDAAHECYQPVDSKERWLISDPTHNDTVGINIRENLERVINTFFRQFNSNSLLAFWKLQYPQSINPNGSLNLGNIVATLQPIMQRQAAPLFISDGVYPLTGGGTVTLPSVYIAVPKNAVGLAGALNPGRLKLVKVCELADHIVWIRFLDGVSLFHYGALQECEMDYLHCCLQGDHIGVHLWETEKMNWKDLPNPLPRAARPVGYNNQVQLEYDDKMLARIEALKEKGKIHYDATTNKIVLYFNTQKTLTDLETLYNDVVAMNDDPDQTKARLEAVMATREKKALLIDDAILSGSYAARTNPVDDLIGDMLMQRPAMIETLENDLAETAYLLAKIKAHVSVGDFNKALLDKAGELAELFAFGVLTRPNPVHIVYNYGGNANILYNAMKDNAAYATRFHAGYALEVCVAAKLMDMEDADHPEHSMLIRLNELAAEMNNAINGSDEDRFLAQFAKFQQTAPELKKKWDAAYNALALAKPETLNMTASDKRLCMGFIDGMRQALNARALGFGFVL